MKFSVAASVLGLASMAVASPAGAYSEGIEARDDKCLKISDRDAKNYIARTIAFWERKGGDRNIEKNAEAIFSKDFKLFSDSINSARGFPIDDQPVYSSRQEFVNDFRNNIPKIKKDTILDYAIDCNTFILFQRLDIGNDYDSSRTQTIEIQQLEESKQYGFVAKRTHAEFNSVVWGEAFGGKYTPPAQKDNNHNDDDNNDDKDGH